MHDFHLTILLAHNPLSSSGYPMITYTHPVANNFPIKTLVARQLPTNNIIVQIHVHACVYMYVLHCTCTRMYSSVLVYTT